MFSSQELLIVGSIPHKNKNSSIGGTTILMQNLLSFLNGKISYRLITFNKFFFKGATLLNAIYTTVMLIVYVPFSKYVMINTSRNGAFYIAPFVYLYCKLFSVKFIFRMFGGNLVDLIKSNPKILVSLFFNTVAKANLIFVETKALVNYMGKINTNVKWYPNIRKINDDDCIAPSDYKKRFVFIGHIKKSKGIAEIIGAFNSLNNSYSVHLYGIIKDDVFKNLSLHNNINYMGVLEPSEVIPTLRNYDVLILPTYHLGEGYPGVIIEAYSQGLPVITTRWKQIPEIVLNNKTGFLITPKSETELIKAIMKFTPQNYSRLSINARNYFNNFNSELVNAKILNELLKLKK